MTEQLPARSLEDLLRRLSSRKEAARAEALREARALPPEDLLELVRLTHRSGSRAWKQAGKISGIVVTLYFLEQVFNQKLYPLDVALIALSMPISLRLSSAATSRQQALAKLLEEVEDVRFIGPALALLHPVETRDKATKQVARSVLKRLLPRLTATDHDLLTSAQKHSLLILLTMRYDDVDLTLAILKALEQIGDEKAIPVVEELSHEPAASVNMRRVRDAANDCLPFLRARVKQAEQSQMLLRASMPDAPDTLLRAASAQPDVTPAEELLRPQESEHETRIQRTANDATTQSSVLQRSSNG